MRVNTHAIGKQLGKYTTTEESYEPGPYAAVFIDEIPSLNDNVGSLQFNCIFLSNKMLLSFPFFQLFISRNMELDYRLY